MSVTPQAPVAASKPLLISPIELVKKSIDFYKQNFNSFIKMMIIGFLASLPIYVAGMIFVVARLFLGYSLGLMILIGVVFLVAIVVTIYFGIRAQIGMMLILKSPEKSFKELFRATKVFFWKFFILNLLLGVLIFLWTLLLVVPGIIFAVFYCFASYVLIFEGLPDMRAIARSQQLVKGYWWAVFGRLGVLFAIAIVLSLILSIPLEWWPRNTWLGFSYNFLTSLIWAIITPAFLVYTYIIYRHLAEIKGVNKNN